MIYMNRIKNFEYDSCLQIQKIRSVWYNLGTFID